MLRMQGFNYENQALSHQILNDAGKMVAYRRLSEGWGSGGTHWRITCMGQCKFVSADLKVVSIFQI